MAYSATEFHDQLRRSPGLSDGAFRVAVMLSGYADAQGRCWPSQRRLARDLERSVRKIKYALKELQDHDIIEYQIRARHKGERSTIQLKIGNPVGSGARTCTGARTDTGARFDHEPVQDSVTNRCKILHPELPQELPHRTNPFLTDERGSNGSSRAHHSGDGRSANGEF